MQRCQSPICSTTLNKFRNSVCYSLSESTCTAAIYMKSSSIGDAGEKHRSVFSDANAHERGVTCFVCELLWETHRQGEQCSDIWKRLPCYTLPSRSVCWDGTLLKVFVYRYRIAVYSLHLVMRELASSHWHTIKSVVSYPVTHYHSMVLQYKSIEHDNDAWKLNPSKKFLWTI